MTAARGGPRARHGSSRPPSRQPGNPGRKAGASIHARSGQAHQPPAEILDEMAADNTCPSTRPKVYQHGSISSCDAIADRDCCGIRVAGNSSARQRARNERYRFVRRITSLSGGVVAPPKRGFPPTATSSRRQVGHQVGHRIGHGPPGERLSRWRQAWVPRELGERAGSMIIRYLFGRCFALIIC